MDIAHDSEIADEAERIVYVRHVDPADLPDEIRAKTGDIEDLYALHAPNGDRLALVKDRKLAYILARQNNFSPVAVH